VRPTLPNALGFSTYNLQLNTPSSRSTNSLASNRHTSDDDDLDNLPYPVPLPREAFLSHDFKPATYLSTLHNRHQTLSDLRAELRTRSQTLAKELLDLVNNEYQAFLTLGSDLSGGDEKVEEVRVGVLGFVKGVGQVRETVEERRHVAGELVAERERIWKEREVGRGLVEVNTRVGELEEILAVTGEGREDVSEDESEEEDEDEEEEGGQSLMGVGRLERLVRSYLGVRQLVEVIGPEHPFLVRQEGRLIRIRNTLLLDLGTSLKQAKASGQSAKNKLLRIVSLYGEMDEAKEAIKLLKESTAPR